MAFGEWLEKINNYKAGQGFQLTANPNDPNQQSQWAIGKQNEIANKGLFDPAQLQELMKIFAPYYQQQTANLNRAQTNALSGATRQTGAYASAYGYDNPYPMVQRARTSVLNTYAPQFTQLQESQLGGLLNAGVQNQQFKYGNAQNLSSLWNQRFMLNEELMNQPGFWENFLSGLMKGGAQIGSAALMAPRAPVPA